MGRSRILQRVLDTWNGHNPDQGVRVSPALERWVADRVTPGKAYCSGRSAWCSHCGRPFPCDGDSHQKVIRCPHCGRPLIVDAFNGRMSRYDEKGYVQELTVWNGFQVIRTYYWQSFRHKGEEESVTVDRVYDWLFDETGRKWCFARRTAICGYNARDPWSWTNLTLRYVSDAHKSDWYNGWTVQAVYPRRKLTPWARMRGMAGDLMCFDANDLLAELMKLPCLETVFKAGHRQLTKFFMYDGGSEKWWPQVKIALRAGFNFVDPSMWADYMGDLRDLGRDINSPKWNAPDDLVRAHDTTRAELERKRQNSRRKEESDRLMSILAPDSVQNTSYRARIAGLIGFVVTDGNIAIRALQDMDDFRHEGEILHHCVFDRAYYSRTDSLILDASVDGQRMETVEVNLRDMSIEQCRGPHNVDSPYHAAILSAVRAALPEFKSRLIKK